MITDHAKTLPTDAGIWKLRCRGCNATFEVTLGGAERILQYVKEHRCPNCGAKPKIHKEQDLRFDWHDILDFRFSNNSKN